MHKQKSVKLLWWNDKVLNARESSKTEKTLNASASLPYPFLLPRGAKDFLEVEEKSGFVGKTGII